MRGVVELHTGEPHGPNIIPRPWVRELISSRLPDASIIETNTYYDGERYHTADHRKTLEINGWNFCPVDIIDEAGTTLLPVPGGKWFSEMSMGKDIWNGAATAAALILCATPDGREGYQAIFRRRRAKVGYGMPFAWDAGLRPITRNFLMV